MLCMKLIYLIANFVVNLNLQGIIQLRQIRIKDITAYFIDVAVWSLSLNEDVSLAFHHIDEFTTYRSKIRGFLTFYCKRKMLSMRKVDVHMNGFSRLSRCLSDKTTIHGVYDPHKSAFGEIFCAMIS